MKRFFLVCTLCGELALCGHAQSLSAWIEQLAALQTLQHTIRQDYQTMTGGLQNIGVIRNQEYQLHRAYFGSLDTVSVAVGNDPLLAELRSRLTALIQQVQTSLQYWQRQPILSP